MKSDLEQPPNDPRTVERSPQKQPTSDGAVTTGVTERALHKAWSDHGLSDQHSTPAQHGALTGGGRAARKSKTRFKGPEGLPGSPGDQKYLGRA